MAYLIGVDGGTESLRAFVFDLEGRPRGSHASAYQTHFPQPSWAEQNPEDWWQAHGRSGAWRGERRRHPRQGRACALRRYDLLFGGGGRPGWKVRSAPR